MGRVAQGLSVNQVLGAPVEECTGRMGAASLPLSLAGAGDTFQGRGGLQESDEEEGVLGAGKVTFAGQSRQHEHRLRVQGSSELERPRRGPLGPGGGVQGAGHRQDLTWGSWEAGRGVWTLS